MYNAGELVPNIIKGVESVPLVTDEEVGIFNAIGKPTQLIPSKVGIKGMEMGTKAEIPAQKSYVRELLCYPNFEYK